MAKLQLYISKYLRGHSALLNINPEEEVSRYIVDFRPALETIEYDTARSNVFYLLNYLEEGLLLSVIKTVAGADDGEYIAASVFHSFGLEIADADFLKLIENLGATLSDDAASPTAEQIADLRAVFATDYALDASAPQRLVSKGHIYGFCYFGGDTPALADYSAVGFFQPRFSRFAGVLLVDRTTGARGRDQHNDLTQNPVVQTTTLLPPGRTKEGFMPHIYHHAFDRPVLVPLNTDIEIRWHRPGFDSFMQTVRATQPGKPVRVVAPDTSEARKIISPASFYITEQGSQRTVGAFIIKVNGVEIDQPHSFPFTELTEARVEISSPGYFAFSGILDLASTAQALVQLKQLRRTYRFDLPLHTPDPTEAIRIYLKTKKPITECPVEGYAIAGGEIIEGAGVSNNLYYVGGRGRRFFINIALISLVSLLLGVLIGWLGAKVSSNDKPRNHVAAVAEAATTTTENVVEDLPAVAETPAEAAAEEAVADTPEVPAVADYAAAVSYLDSNKKWERAAMESTPGLAGLFDDLNNYNFDRITTYWAPLLGESRNFAAVVAAVKGSATKRSPRTAPHDPAFVPEGDTSISWLSYTYWVDP